MKHSTFFACLHTSLHPFETARSTRIVAESTCQRKWLLRAHTRAADFLGRGALLRVAWGGLHGPNGTCCNPPDDESVGRWRGYLRRANETQDVPDTWEDEGGALAGSWLNANTSGTGS